MTQQKCPRCDSPAPHLHPAVQFEGEVQECSHPFHQTITNQNRNPTPPTDHERLDAIRQKAEACELVYLTALAEQVVKEDVPWLLDRLAALEHERDDWKEKHRLQGEAHRGDMRNALADLDKAEAALLSLQTPRDDLIASWRRTGALSRNPAYGICADELVAATSRNNRQATAEERAMARGFVTLWESVGVQDADDWLYTLRNRAELLASLDEDDCREAQDNTPSLGPHSAALLPDPAGTT